MNEKTLNRHASELGTISFVGNPPEMALWVEGKEGQGKMVVLSNTVEALRAEGIEPSWETKGNISIIAAPLEALPILVEFKARMRG